MTISGSGGVFSLALGVFCGEWGGWVILWLLMVLGIPNGYGFEVMLKKHEKNWTKKT